MNVLGISLFCLLWLLVGAALQYGYFERRFLRLFDRRGWQKWERALAIVAWLVILVLDGLVRTMNWIYRSDRVWTLVETVGDKFRRA